MYDVLSPSPSRFCFHQRLFVCLFVRRFTTQPILNFHKVAVAHGSRKKRLDFGCQPDLNPDPNFFEESYHCILGMINVRHRGFDSCPEIRRLADLKLNELNAALVEVCALPLLLF